MSWGAESRTKNLNGKILVAFPDNCGLQTLALNKNQLEEGYQNLWPIALGWRSWTLGTTTSRAPSSHFT